MSDAGSRSMSRRDHRATKSRPPRPTVLGVIELLITAGLFILLFVVWELYWTNLGANREAQAHRDTMSEMFDTQYEAGFNGTDPTHRCLNTPMMLGDALYATIRRRLLSAGT